MVTKLPRVCGNNLHRPLLSPGARTWVYRYVSGGWWGGFACRMHVSWVRGRPLLGSSASHGRTHRLDLDTRRREMCPHKIVHACARPCIGGLSQRPLPYTSGPGAGRVTAPTMTATTASG